MSDELLTKEDLAVVEKEIAETKAKLKTSLTEKEREAMEKTIRQEIEEKIKKDLEEKKKKEAEEAAEAAKKADQESQLSRLKELEEKYNLLLEKQTQSQGTASGNPYDSSEKKDINDYSYDELAAIDAASMAVFFKEKQGLNFRN